MIFSSAVSSLLLGPSDLLFLSDIVVFTVSILSYFYYFVLFYAYSFHLSSSIPSLLSTFSTRSFHITCILEELFVHLNTLAIFWSVLWTILALFRYLDSVYRRFHCLRDMAMFFSSQLLEVWAVVWLWGSLNASQLGSQSFGSVQSSLCFAAPLTPAFTTIGNLNLADLLPAFREPLQ